MLIEQKQIYSIDFNFWNFFFYKSYAWNKENKNKFSESLKKEAGGDVKHGATWALKQLASIITHTCTCTYMYMYMYMYIYIIICLPQTTVFLFCRRPSPVAVMHSPSFLLNRLFLCLGNKLYTYISHACPGHVLSAAARFSFKNVHDRITWVVTNSTGHVRLELWKLQAPEREFFSVGGLRKKRGIIHMHPAYRPNQEKLWVPRSLFFFVFHYWQYKVVGCYNNEIYMNNSFFAQPTYGKKLARRTPDGRWTTGDRRRAMTEIEHRVIRTSGTNIGLSIQSAVNIETDESAKRMDYGRNNIGFPANFDKYIIQFDTRLIQFRLKKNAQLHQHSTVKKSHSISTQFTQQIRSFNFNTWAFTRQIRSFNFKWSLSSFNFVKASSNRLVDYSISSMSNHFPNVCIQIRFCDNVLSGSYLPINKGRIFWGEIISTLVPSYTPLSK